MKKIIKIIYVLQIVFLLGFFSCKNANVISYQKYNQGITFKLNEGNLEIAVISDKVFRCRYYKTNTSHFRKSLMVVDQKADSVSWTVEEKPGSYSIKTNSLIAEVDAKTGLISFFDKDMKPIVKENERELIPKDISGEHVFNISQTFGLTPDEAIYGLGQNQKGYMNLRGDSLELFQRNQEDYIPVIISTKGYGILWDNYSYTLFKDNANGMNLWSEVGDGIEYYFMYGPALDTVIANYRNLTGGCPMLPKWAFGYVICKERYKTQEEILSVVKEHRERQIPLDVIVQDWRYWSKGQWGQKTFDPVRYPNPEKMISELHNKYNTKFMVSVWGIMNEGFPNSNEIMNTPGSNYYRIKKGEINYDPFNQVACDLYWKQCNEGMFSKGVDAWWCDATEPEMDHAFNIKAESNRERMNTSLGSGSRYMCAYPLMHSKNIYDNQRKTSSDKRVVNLTRSGFGGQQRYSTIVWSGDILATWDIFKNQISAGLNFVSSGIPYWTTDIGAFSVIPWDNRGDYGMGTKNDEYKELYLRWFQFGAFCPMFRSHGTNFAREMWRFGEKGSWCYDALIKMDQLRYRLLPYIYSVGWKVTNEGYTMMRPLAFDFQADKNVYDNGTQFMFGQAFMVSPVTELQHNKGKGNAVFVESSNLFNGGKVGLRGEYYKGLDFKNKVGERIDSMIKFSLESKPLKGMDGEQFSIRFTGKILSKEAGEYIFMTSYDDRSKLWVNNKLIINGRLNNGSDDKSGVITLAANTKYDIRMEFSDYDWDIPVELLWLTPGMTKSNVVENKKNTIQVYLPANTKWYNFWTGETTDGGKIIDSPSPIDQIPLYIKAGSIIPMGPVMQYATEKPADPIELRVYAGDDADFTLYEDENDNYNYEKGKYATISMHWNEKAQTLTIGKQQGEFTGMLKKRTFKVVFVGKNHGNGIETSVIADKQIQYSGNEVVLTFR